MGAVEMAEVAERAGLDLMSFKNHPYHPGYLDSWTPLSYVAARTSRIRPTHNVRNLPLRQPATLGRAAASIDLLSRGRFELALGPGRVWDAIEAMRGPRRTPGEAVEAIEEAITIIRETWATSRPGGVFVNGQQYRIWGAAREGRARTSAS